MSASTRRAADAVWEDSAIIEPVAGTESMTVAGISALGLAALERRARDLIAGNLRSTPDGRRAAAAYLRDIDGWADRHGDPYIVSFASRPPSYVEGRIARAREFNAIRRDVVYRQVEDDVLRSDLFAEVGRRLPGAADLPRSARTLAQAPAHPITVTRHGDGTPQESMG